MVDNTKFGVEIKVDADEAIKKLMVLSAVMKQFADTTEKETNKAGASFSNMGFSIKNALNALGITLAGLSFANLITGALKSSAELESAAVSFEVFTGSAEVAKQLMEDFKAIAIKSPMQFQDIVQGGKVLMNYGITTQQVIPLVKMLGDISGGNSDRFSRLALAFGQVNGAGRLMGQELRQMINAGFNPLQVISERTGESMASLQDRMRNGQISIREVGQAFVYATTEGGRFFQNSEKQSQTLLGAYNKLSEGLKFTLAEIGDNIARTFDLKGAAETASAMFGLLSMNFKTINEEGAKSAFWSEALKTNLRDVALVLDLAIKGFMFLGQVIENISGPIDSLSDRLDKFVISFAGNAFDKNVQDVVKNVIDYVNNFGKESEKVAKQKSPFEKLKADYEAFIKSFNDKPAVDAGDGQTKAERNRFEKLSQQAKEGYSELENQFKTSHERRIDIFNRYAQEELKKYEKLGIDTTNIRKKHFDIGRKIEKEELAKMLHLVNKPFSFTKIINSLSDMADAQIDKFSKIAGVIKPAFDASNSSIRLTTQELLRFSSGMQMVLTMNEQFADEFTNRFITLSSTIKASVKDLVVNGLSTLADAFQSLGSGEGGVSSIRKFTSGILSALGDMFIKIGTGIVMASEAALIIQKFLASMFTNPATGVIGGLALIAVGGLLKGVASNLAKQTRTVTGGTQSSQQQSMSSGTRYAFGGSAFNAQTVRLQIDLTGAITASPSGYNINKSFETVLRVTGRE